jgi:outer membrane biosynthesis protein TonB
LAEVAGRPDAEAAIATLARRGLVESEARSEEAVRLAPDVAALPEARAFAGTGASPRRLLSALIEGVRNAVEVRRRAAPIEHLASAVLASGDARMVLWLAQTYGEYLAAAGALGRWQRLLELGLRAARGVGDRAAEAWSLHQLGTRALLVGDRAHAEALLRQALSIRTAIGDGAGIRATQHNLGVLLGVPPPPPQRPVRRTSSGGGDFPVGMLAFVAVLVIAAVVALGVLLYRSGGLPGATPVPFASQAPPPSPEGAVSPSPIPPARPTLTPEPSATPASPSPSPTDTASPAASNAPVPATSAPDASPSPSPSPVPATAPASTSTASAPASAVPTAAPLRIDAAAAECATGPGLRYSISGRATSLVIAGRGIVPVVIPSPPSEGCVQLVPGSYMLRASRGSKSATAFASVAAQPTPVPPSPVSKPMPVPVPTPTPTPVPPRLT